MPQANIPGRALSGHSWHPGTTWRRPNLLLFIQELSLVSYRQKGSIASLAGSLDSPKLAPTQTTKSCCHANHSCPLTAMLISVLPQLAAVQTASYSLNSTGGSGGGYVDPLNFTVRNASISECNHLSSGGTGAYFAADVLNLSGKTGAIGATVAAVPEPESYAMLLSGLGLIGFVARRRQQAASRV